MAKVFQRDEHEFLRLAAMAEPDCEELCQLVREGFDWRYLRETALLHQLDGVVAWRLVAPELAGRVPNSVRDECRRYIDKLDEERTKAGQPLLEPNRRLWAEQAAMVFAALKEAHIPYVVISSAPAYALYGMQHWPCILTELQIAVPSSHYDVVQSVLTGDPLAIGKPRAPHVKSAFNDPRFTWPEFLDIHTYPPSHDFITADAVFTDDVMFENNQIIQYCGTDFQVPYAEAWLVMLAAKLYSQIQWPGAPMSLGGLSRMYNIIVAQSIGWGRLTKLLRNFWDKTMWRVEEGGKFADLPPEEAPAIVRRRDVSLFVGWILRQMDMVYPCVPQTFWDSLRDFQTDLIPMVLARDGFYSDEGEPLWTLTNPPPTSDFCLYCEWQNVPAPEDFLFTFYGVRGLKARLKAGMWKVMEPEVRISMYQDDWASANLGPLWCGLP